MGKIVSKLQWSSNPVKVRLFQYDKITGNLESVDLSPGQDLNFRLVDSGYCIGSEGEAGWKSCMENTGKDSPNIALQGKQCFECSKADYYSCRKTCRGDVCIPSSDLAKQACAPPKTGVYLTSVGHRFKVGVSRNPKRRWVEQGSDFAIELAELPGLEARALENAISEEFGLRQSVTSRTKLKNFQSDKRSKFEEKVNDVLSPSKTVFQDLVNQRKVEGNFHEDAAIEDLTVHYGSVPDGATISEVEMNPGQEFGGTVVAIKGSIIVVKNGIYFRAILVGKLQGWEIDPIEEAEVKGQLSIDEWF